MKKLHYILWTPIVADRCRMSYTHDFDDYPCRKCNMNAYSFGQTLIHKNVARLLVVILLIIMCLIIY